ncbi:MAG TPA: copper homeostasis protein CutC [Bryobacteraceae bacterium]|jgi:copper homeostasis protein|nr:copper homeostasis protein CutC [Bryobacteraceae bacterium]
MRRLLEVIACSVQDAVEAEAGGADRIELVRDLHLGGLTPPIELVHSVLGAVKIPVRAMVRETLGFEVNDSAAAQRLHAAAQAFSGLRLDGLVLGFLKDGAVDCELTASVLASAGGLPATFHHAFESAHDPLQAIAVLKTLPRIDRILTYGGAGGWKEKSERLRQYQAAASPEITILVGGGVDEDVIRLLTAETMLEEFHAGRAVRVPPETSGTVGRERVRNLGGHLSHGTNSR